MKRISIAAAVLAGAWLSSPARAGEPRWKQHTINGKSEFEAAAAFDVDGDGKLDILSGDSWYQAPDWKRHPVREVQRQGTYYNDFAVVPIDVDGDGDLDFATASYFGKDVAWVENPGKAGETWTYHQIDTPGTSEAAVAVDLSGDGVPDILPNSTNVVVWYEVAKKADGKGVEFKKHDFGTEAAGHGVGTGDVNGDGRTDLLTPKGWFEAPADASRETWTWHPDWNLGATGIQILAKDVDGDGLADLVYGMGHDFGLYWAKQSKGADGKSTWTKAPIDETVASVHTQLWADVDGDGKADELISGKRVYAHEIEPGATDGSLVAWYKFDPKAGRWAKHVVFQGEPAKNAPENGAERLALRDFPVGTAGTGLQVSAVDVDGDGDIDLVCPGKSGLYLFENLGAEE
jgi:hypothetical protein